MERRARAVEAGMMRDVYLTETLNIGYVVEDLPCSSCVNPHHYS